MYVTKQKELDVAFVIRAGGMGDLVGALPSIKYVVDHHPHVRPHLFLADFAVEFARRSLPSQVKVYGFHQLKSRLKPDWHARSIEHFYQHTNLATHIVDHAFHIFVNKQVDIEFKNYLPVNIDGLDIDRYKLPKKFIVAAPGFTANVREFIPETFNQVMQYIRDKGYSIVFLGKEKASNGANHVIQPDFNKQIDYGAGLNLINKTTMSEVAGIISRSSGVIGLDNGILHIAGTVPEVPIIAGYSNVEPCYRMPYRNNMLGYKTYPVVPPASLACRFCQSNRTFTIGHHFTTCPEDVRATGKQIKCLGLLTTNLWVEQIDKGIL